LNSGCGQPELYVVRNLAQVSLLQGSKFADNDILGEKNGDSAEHDKKAEGYEGDPEIAAIA